MIRKKDFSFFSTYLLAREAEKRGATIEKFYPKTKQSFIIIKYKNKIETIMGQRISTLSYNASFICSNKVFCKILLKRNGIKTSEGKYFSKTKIPDSLAYIQKIGFPIVIKPLYGTWGDGVYTGIADIAAAKRAIKKILASGERKRFLVEKQFVGEEYRILATKNKLLGIINRIPANVIGDGKNNIKNLISKKNDDKRRGEGHSESLVKIKIDSEIIETLKKKHLTLASVPKKGEQVFLRIKSNLSAGGDSIDVTDKAHPNIKKLATKVILSIPNLPYAGFDFMTKDITKDPFKTDYIVIEINESPMLSMHHFPFRGKRRNVAKDIIDLIF